MNDPNRRLRQLLMMPLRAFHRAQQGAVALMCLAATLIIFMTTLTMFDSGWASQEKFTAQMSADSAAFSSAAVKARAMNSIAYMNVVKRTLVGMFEMYTAMMYAFRLNLDATLTCLAEVTGELVDYEAETAAYEQEMAAFEAACSGGGVGERGGGDRGIDEGGGRGRGGDRSAGNNDDDDDDGGGGGDDPCDSPPDAPNAPATTICPGCEAVTTTETYDGMVFPSFTLFGIDYGLLYESLTMTSMEQDCPIQNIFEAEAKLDWIAFANTDAYDLQTYRGPFDGVVTKFIRINLRTLTNFQDMLIMLAPQWAAAEAEQRGLFSGAEFVITQDFTELPVERGTWVDLCLGRNGHMDPNNKSGPALLAEINANLMAHTLRSHPDSGFTDHAVTLQASQYMDTIGCEAARTSLYAGDGWEMLIANMFGGGLIADLFLGGDIGDDKGHMFPYHPTDQYVRDYFQTTRTSKLTTGYARQKFNYMSADYGSAGNSVPEAYEGMSCGEAVNLNPEYKMWRASWGPRIAPAQECDPELWMHWK